MRSTSYYSVFILLVFACTPKPTTETDQSVDQDNGVLANELAQKYIITDGHVDLPYRLKNDGYMDAEAMLDLRNSNEGNFDFARAVAGGLNAPFMSIYLPARLQESGGSKELADSLINMVERIANDFPEHFALANSPDEVVANFEKGLISLPMGMENGSGIEDNIENVKYFSDRGIRYVTLTHSKDNLICDSSYDTTRTWNGLSPYGEEVVREMNRTGIMVDVSHISDSTFYDVMALTDIPCIASHSSCRHFTADFERNMSDDMIKLLAKNGGVIQINFGSTFLAKASRDKWDELDGVVQQMKTENPELTDSTETVFRNQWLIDNKAFADVNTVADHIDHVVAVAGIDHVGFGSDYDGVGNSLPTGLKDVTGFPNLIEELLNRGYTEEDIEKICSKNVFRVWNKVLEMASK
jgi:membrane dipeptidase